MHQHPHLISQLAQQENGRAMRTGMVLTAAGALLAAVAIAACGSTSTANQLPTPTTGASNTGSSSTIASGNTACWPGINDLEALHSDLMSMAQDEGNPEEDSSQTSAEIEAISNDAAATNSAGSPPAQYSTDVSTLLDTLAAESDDPSASGAAMYGMQALEYAEDLTQAC